MKFGSRQSILTEFDFRYNHRCALGIEDNQRVVDALAGPERIEAVVAEQRMRTDRLH